VCERIIKATKSQNFKQKNSLAPQIVAHYLNGLWLRTHKNLQSICWYFNALLGSTRLKAGHKMLMKLTPGLNFINVLHTAFTPADPKGVKSYWWLTVFFTLSGSTCLKAGRKLLLKFTPGLCWIQIQIESNQTLHLQSWWVRGEKVHWNNRLHQLVPIVGQSKEKDI